LEERKLAKGMRVSGVGKGARRTDLDRAAKIQREAKMQNAVGGSYGERGALTELAQGAPMAQSNPMTFTQGRNVVPTVGIFDPTTRPEEPITTGIRQGDGAGEEVLMTPVDAPDQLATFARAMCMANPTPMLRRIVEAFEEEAR